MAVGERLECVEARGGGRRVCKRAFKLLDLVYRGPDLVNQSYDEPRNHQATRIKGQLSPL